MRFEIYIKLQDDTIIVASPNYKTLEDAEYIAKETVRVLKAKEYRIVKIAED